MAIYCDICGNIGDEHYNITSALHKSVRGCDENAALYWLTRMMLGGEDPKTIARRLIRMASEDIGIVAKLFLYSALKYFTLNQLFLNCVRWHTSLKRLLSVPEHVL